MVIRPESADSLNDRLNDVLNDVLNDGLNQSEQELLILIAVAPGMTKNWYSQKTGFSIANVQRIMKKLRGKGRISRGNRKMAQISIRVDDTVKAKAESACSDMGMTITTAINIFLVKLGNERRIPFEVSAQPVMSKNDAESTFLQKMKAAEDEITKGDFKTSEEMHKILGV